MRFFVIGGLDAPKFVLLARDRSVIGCGAGEPPTWGRWNARCGAAYWTPSVVAAPSCALPHLASQVRIGPSNSSSYRPVRWERARLGASSRDSRLIESHAKRGMVGRRTVPKKLQRLVICNIQYIGAMTKGIFTRFMSVSVQCQWENVHQTCSNA